MRTPGEPATGPHVAPSPVQSVSLVQFFRQKPANPFGALLKSGAPVDVSFTGKSESHVYPVGHVDDPISQYAVQYPEPEVPARQLHGGGNFIASALVHASPIFLVKVVKRLMQNPCST